MCQRRREGVAYWLLDLDVGGLGGHLLRGLGLLRDDLFGRHFEVCASLHVPVSIGYAKCIGMVLSLTRVEELTWYLGLGSRSMVCFGEEIVAGSRRETVWIWGRVVTLDLLHRFYARQVLMLIAVWCSVSVSVLSVR